MSHETIKLHHWNVTTSELFARWQLEHRNLQLSVDQLRRWIFEVSQSAEARYAETADRLMSLRGRLMEHFDRENMLGRQLLASQPGAALELAAMCRQCDSDHELLLGRLDDLVVRLRQCPPRVASWSATTHEAELLVDGVEEHEELEADRVKCWLGGS